MKPKGKVLIGLTGIFGSGKTTVANLFAELGACVVDADKIAHEALRRESVVFKEVSGLFEGAVDISSGDLDRKKIAEIIFRDEAKRKALEKIVHPYVMKRIVEEAGRAEERGIVLEVPLLFEAGFDSFCDAVVTVANRPEKIKARLIQKGYGEEEIERRWKAQWPLEEKIKKANFVIENSGTLEQTRREVESVWKKLSGRFEKGEKNPTWQEKK